MGVEIAAFRPEHARRFEQLNRAWLESFGLMEPAEHEQLGDPQTYFIERGGQIFVALNEGEVIGTCAVIPCGVEEVELAKLTVSAEFRGQGIARALVQRSIAYAHEKGARRVTLVSNLRLQPALRLYESLGFRYCPVPEDAKYEVADVAMVLEVDNNRG